MNLDKDGLAPCGGCGNDDPAKRCIGCMHQFHTAIPNTGDELVAKLRAMCIDWDARPMDDGELPRIEPHCRDLREAADAITSLTAECEALTRRASSDDRRKRMFRRNVRLRLDAEARAQAAEASLASARGDALEEAAKLIESGFDREGITTKHDKCPHGLYGWEDCEQCAVAAIRAVSSRPRSPRGQQ